MEKINFEWLLILYKFYGMNMFNKFGKYSYKMFPEMFSLWHCDMTYLIFVLFKLSADLLADKLSFNRFKWHIRCLKDMTPNDQKKETKINERTCWKHPGLFYNDCIFNRSAQRLGCKNAPTNLGCMNRNIGFRTKKHLSPLFPGVWNAFRTSSLNLGTAF